MAFKTNKETPHETNKTHKRKERKKEELPVDYATKSTYT